MEGRKLTSATRAERIDDMLEAIKEMHKLPSDAALARRLGVMPPVISKIRAESIPVGATMIISIHEETGWPIAYIKAIIAADPVPVIEAGAA